MPLAKNQKLESKRDGIIEAGFWRAGRDLNPVRLGDNIARASFFAASFPFFKQVQESPYS